MMLPEAFNVDFTQAEVDFVIPAIDEDLPLCIDPFLLYKSRDESLRTLHGRLVSMFNSAIGLFRSGRLDEFYKLIDFPEVNEIGFGYSEGAIRGSGLGQHLNRLLADTLAASEPLKERGLRHVEELQLVSLGIGADRVSDIAANALKLYLVGYTRTQAELWNIPLESSVPVHHYFDFEEFAWRDAYFDLPRNPLNGMPLLLVPRRVVRLLPWINFEDYTATDFSMFLRSGAGKGWSKFSGMPRGRRTIPNKAEVIQVTRSNIKLIDNYVARKERESAKALPAYVTEMDLGPPVKPKADEFIGRLAEIPTGTASASSYQRLVYEMVNYLFEPELTDGELEVRTLEGTERRDIIYTNESEASFWQYVRLSYGSPLVLFEVKNVEQLEMEHMNQIATYLGARLGMLGFLVTRHAPTENIVRKAYSVYNDSPAQPRKIILVLSDEDLGIMLRSKDSGGTPTPTQYVQRKYRDFRTKCQ